MRRLKIEGIIEYDDDLMHGHSADGKKLFLDILYTDRLTVVSEEIGDEVGELKITKIRRLPKQKEAKP